MDTERRRKNSVQGQHKRAVGTGLTMDRKERRNEATRREIRDAAARLFFTRGFREVTMADIGREVGLSPGSLYYYFRNKEDILRELDAECVQRFEEFLETFNVNDGGLRETLIVFFDAVFRFARDNRDYFVFLTRLVSSVHPALLGEITHNRLRAFASARTFLTGLMRKFQARGEARVDLPAEELAHFLGGVVHSVLFSWFMGIIPDQEMPKKFEMFTEMLVNGVRAREE